jgi:hypothetical protein
LAIFVLPLLIGLCVPLHAPAPAGKPVPVTVDNYNRAETDNTFDGVRKQGGFGKFAH